jgi:hypothetical protein
LFLVIGIDDLGQFGFLIFFLASHRDEDAGEEEYFFHDEDS